WNLTAENAQDRGRLEQFGRPAGDARVPARQGLPAQGAVVPLGCAPFEDVRPDAAWLARDDGAVARLGGAIYEWRSLSDGTLDQTALAMLADALEAGGCDNEEILSHCRLEGTAHVRGCWVVDLILSKVR